MSTPLSLVARLARVTALRDVIDANGGGQVLFYEAISPETPLPTTPETVIAALPVATLDLETPTSGSVEATGVGEDIATLSIPYATTLVSSQGMIAFLRFVDGAGTGVADVPAGLPGSGMPAILSALQVYTGGELNLVSCVLSE